MRIGHNPAFVFLSNPKCGSTSIRAILGKHSDIMGEKHPTTPIEVTHLTANALKSYFENDMYKEPSEEGEVTVADWSEYYTFTTVRNPWKKMASYYFFWAPDKNMNPAMMRSLGETSEPAVEEAVPRTDLKYDIDSAFSIGFNEWLKYIVDGRGLPTYNYFCCEHINGDPSKAGQCLLDDVFKIEEIDDVLPAALKERLNIDIDGVPKMNPDFTHKGLDTKYTNWKGDYYSLYNQETKDIISQIYESDIEVFNYSFGE